MGFSPHLGSDSGPHRREGRRLTQRTVVWCVSLCVLFSLAVVGIWYGVRAVTPQPLPLGTGTNPASAVTVQQAISLPASGREPVIGVVTTFGDDAEGSAWRLNAQGARVAQYRLALGKSSVKVLYANDKGTEQGAREALEKLSSEGALGIVLASRGEHLRGATAAAKERNVAVIEAYDRVDTGDGVWSFALDPEQEKQVYTTAIRSLAGVSSTGSSQQLDGVRTILLDAGEGSAPDLPYTNRVQVSADEDSMKDTLKELTRLLGDKSSGSSPVLVLTGSASTQAKVLRSLQRAGITSPVIAGEEALTEPFTRLLLENGGSLTDNIRVVGRVQARAAALSADDAGRASSAFVSTVERMKNDSSLKDLSGEQSFSKSAAWADAPSHNALLAFAYATSQVREYTPEAVRRVLGTLRLDAKDSTVAYPLDFSSSYAAGGQVGLLYPTAEASMIQGGSSSTDVVNPPVWMLRTFTSESRD